MNLFRGTIFTLSDKQTGITLELTLSDVESIWHMSEKRNISLHKKLDEFMGRWANRRL